MTSTRLVTFFTAALLALSSVDAAAQGPYGKAHLLYGWELIDLAPDDGIAPTITFNHELRGAVAMAVYSEYSQPIVVEEFRASPEGSVTVVAFTGDVQSSATFDSQQLHAAGDFGEMGYYASYATLDAHYTLSAHTRLLFTGQAIGTLDERADDAGMFSHAQVTVRLSEQPAGPFFSREIASSRPGQGMSFDELFTLELVNDTAAPLSAHLTMLAHSAGNTWAPAPVPEPSTWLMLGAGLAITAAAARRRAARRTEPF